MTFDRVSIHSTPHWVLKLQSQRLELPLYEIPIPFPCTNQQYEAAMQKFLVRMQTLPEYQANLHLAFGDLFLESIRHYRENNLRDTGFTPLFPLWGSDTTQLAETMISSGLRAIVTAGDSRMPRGMVGRWFDRQFLTDLPQDVDPLGENGEFHTCVLDGPMFSSPIHAHPGQIVQRENSSCSKSVTDSQKPLLPYTTYADIIAL